MSSFQQQKIIRQANTQKYGPLQEKKTPNLVETILQEVQTLDLLDQEFKSTVLNMLKDLKETIRTNSDQTENILKRQKL